MQSTTRHPISQKTTGIEKAIVRYLHGVGSEADYLNEIKQEIAVVKNKPFKPTIRNAQKEHMQTEKV